MRLLLHNDHFNLSASSKFILTVYAQQPYTYLTSGVHNLRRQNDFFAAVKLYFKMHVQEAVH